MSHFATLRVNERIYIWIFAPKINIRIYKNNFGHWDIFGLFSNTIQYTILDIMNTLNFEIFQWQMSRVYEDEFFWRAIIFMQRQDYLLLTARPVKLSLEIEAIPPKKVVSIDVYKLNWQIKVLAIQPRKWNIKHYRNFDSLKSFTLNEPD